MDLILDWIKLNPDIVTIILLIVVLIIVIKLVKKVLVWGIIIFLIVGIFVFKGTIFPSAEQVKDMTNRITTEGKSYIESKEYEEDLKFIKDKYPDLVDIVDKKTKEVLGE